MLHWGQGGQAGAGGAAKVLSSVVCPVWGQDVGPGHGARPWGQASSLHVVTCSEALELHFIDELDEKQSGQGQVVEPNSCTKPVK